MKNQEQIKSNRVDVKLKKEAIYRSFRSKSEWQKKTAKCWKLKWIDAVSIVFMCWEQSLNLLSIAFTDYIVHYFRCVFFCFHFVVLLVPCFSSFFFLIVVVDSPCWFLQRVLFLSVFIMHPFSLDCIVFAPSPSIVHSMDAVRDYIHHIAPEKCVIKNIIRTASLKTMSNSIIFNPQYLTPFWNDWILLACVFLSFVFECVYTRWISFDRIYSVGLAVLEIGNSTIGVVFVIWFLQTHIFLLQIDRMEHISTPFPRNVAAAIAAAAAAVASTSSTTTIAKRINILN